MTVTSVRLRHLFGECDTHVGQHGRAPSCGWRVPPRVGGVLHSVGGAASCATTVGTTPRHLAAFSAGAPRLAATIQLSVRAILASECCRGVASDGEIQGRRPRFRRWGCRLRCVGCGLTGIRVVLRFSRSLLPHVLGVFVDWAVASFFRQRPHRYPGGFTFNCSFTA